jgi:hypothetical protein
MLFRRNLTLFKVTVRGLHRAVVQALDEMNELHVRLDVRTARSDIVGLENEVGTTLANYLLAEGLAEPAR